MSSPRGLAAPQRKRPRWEQFTLSALALLALHCQAIFGDFEIETASPPSAPLGTACEASDFRCVGAELEACSADRRGWGKVTTCNGAGEVCDASAGACRSCATGEYSCNGATLEQCDASQHFTVTATCATAERCHVTGDRSSGSCPDPVCDAGSFSCDANRLLACAPGRDYLTLVERCASETLCDPDAAARQVMSGHPATCLTPLCLPGTFACDGATLERCGNDQDAWQPIATCADAASCNPRDGSCTAASSGVTACSGAVLVQSGPNGFTTRATCASALLCDAAAGRCKPRSCGTPGALRCDDTNLPALQVCGEDGQWITREVCATNAFCNATAGRCLTPACDDGDTRCVGNGHQHCSADLTHWEKDETCAAGEACNSGGCEPDGCSAGAFRCVGTSLEECNAGHWQGRLVCATVDLCDATTGVCDDPGCGGALGDYKCMGQKLQNCPATRETFTDFLTCNVAPNVVCDADPMLGSGVPGCDLCEPLTYSCNASALQRCAADGQTNPVIASCPGGCSVTGGVPTCTGP